MTTSRALRRVFPAGLVALALLTSADVVGADCQRSCKAELTACKRSRCAGQRGKDRKQCLADCRGRTGCGGGVGTLAYVVTTCRVQGGNLTGAQEIRVRRRGCDPVTVARFANPEPVADLFGLCAFGAGNHRGDLSPLAGFVQRLGVSHDGATIVFEISNQFQLIGRTPLAPEQQGFFSVRSDGTGLRRVGPPSRDPAYRLVAVPGATPVAYTATIESALPFSLDDRTIAFTDRGPGADGVEREQFFAMNLATGERRQLTRFEAYAPHIPTYDPRFLLWPVFNSSHSLLFTYRDGKVTKNVEAELDGSGVREVFTPPPGLERPVGGPIEGHLRVTRPNLDIRSIVRPGLADNYYFDLVRLTPSELFRVMGRRDHIQLTNFNRLDTELVGANSRHVLLRASADPFGTNPFHNCQLFRVSPFGDGLRQVTRFGEGVRSEEECSAYDARPGCGIRSVPQDGTGRSLLVYSDCDPFGTNPEGSQVFAVEYDGSRLRQLTHTAGARTADDGSLELELPGPVVAAGR